MVISRHWVEIRKIFKKGAKLDFSAMKSVFESEVFSWAGSWPFAPLAQRWNYRMTQKTHTDFGSHVVWQCLLWFLVIKIFQKATFREKVTGKGNAKEREILCTSRSTESSRRTFKREKRSRKIYEKGKEGGRMCSPPNFKGVDLNALEQRLGPRE